MIRYKGYEHTHTNHEKDKTKARKEPKNANKYCVFAKEKPKPNTFVFDLGFDWRRERDSNPCASFLTTAFRVRLVMTTSISLQSDYVGEMPNVCNIQHFAGFGNHIAAILQKSFNSDSRKK